LVLKNILWKDIKIPEKISWFIVCFIPLFLYFLNLRDFVGIIGFVGAIMLGIEGILVLLVYRKFSQIKLQKPVSFYIYLLLVVFLLGIFLEINNFL